MGFGSVLPQVHHRSGSQRWVIAALPAGPTEEIPLIIGDCLYAFRSALDHLAWELDSAPGRGTMFPLARCPAELDSAIRRVERFDGDAIGRVLDWQPCYLANNWRAYALWALETLINIDKHRHLNLVTVAAGDAYFWKPGGESQKRHTGPVNVGTVLATFPAGQHQERFAWKPGLTFEQLPAFPPLRKVHSVMRTLIDIDTVVCTLVNEFAAGYFPAAAPFPSPGQPF